VKGRERQAYSQDLRDRVLHACERGDRPTEIAKRFEVSRVWVYQVKGRDEREGNRQSLRQGGYRVSRIAPLEEEIRGWLTVQVDLTLEEICQRLTDLGITLKGPALWNQLNHWGLSYKKTLHAREQAREDVQQARDRWIEEQPALNPEHLKFIDETGVTTNMTRRYGRSPRGARCVAAVPHGHRKTTTFIAALGYHAITAPLVMDGPMESVMFAA